MTDKAKFTVEVEAPAHLEPVLSRGYTVLEAAAECGVSASNLSRVLRGERKPSAALRRKLRRLKQKPLLVKGR